MVKYLSLQVINPGLGRTWLFICVDGKAWFRRSPRCLTVMLCFLHGFWRKEIWAALLLDNKFCKMFLMKIKCVHHVHVGGTKTNNKTKITTTTNRVVPGSTGCSYTMPRHIYDIGTSRLSKGCILKYQAISSNQVLRTQMMRLISQPGYIKAVYSNTRLFLQAWS